MKSKKYTFNQEDINKILTGACIAIAGAGLTYLAQVLGEIDFGIYTPLAVALGAIIINIGRKFLGGK